MSIDARANLEARAAELRAQLATLARDRDGIVAASADANLDDEHDPEGATVAWEREQVAGALARTQLRLTETEAALVRLDDGSYGRCLACGRAIDDERLTARPAAAHCRDCAR